MLKGSKMASKKRCITLEELQAQPVPKSPRKCSENLRCAVLNKRELRPTKNGTMFSMNLCDKDSKSMLRAVCFDEDIYEAFEPSRSYELTGYKIKKAYGRPKAIEMLVDQDTVVSASSVQLEIDKSQCSLFNISQILRREAQNTRFVNVKGKVVKIDEVRTVGTNPDNKRKRDVFLSDETGHIVFVLWRKRAENVNFEEGDVIYLQNVVVSNFNKEVFITTSFETSVVRTDEDMEVKGMPESLPKSNIVSLDTSIEALKDFKSCFKCLLCKANIDVELFTESKTIRCQSCSAMFLKRLAELTNQCTVVIASKEYVATSTVVKHLFNWGQTKLEPTDEDVGNMLSTRYSVRVDLDRKVIEHACPIEDYEAPDSISCSSKIKQD